MTEKWHQISEFIILMNKKLFFDENLTFKVSSFTRPFSCNFSNILTAHSAFPCLSDLPSPTMN